MRHPAAHHRTSGLPRRAAPDGQPARQARRGDEELVRLAKDGDDEALIELLERYQRVAYAKARTYFVAGGDRDDVVQEGMIGLYKAICDYDPDQDASFRSFADLCVTRQILTAVKVANRRKHTPLNSYVPFDQPRAQDTDRTVGEILADEHGDDIDPLGVLVAADELERLEHTVNQLLSELESDVLSLYVEGCSYQEIATELGRHVKSVDNAIQRVKRKLEEHLAQDG